MNGLPRLGMVVKKLLRGRKKWLALSVFLMVALGPYLFSRWMSSAHRVVLFADENLPAEPPFDGSLSIVCFNIAHGRGASDSNWEERGSDKPERVARIGEFLRKLDADLVILNEVDFCSTWSGHQNQAAAIAELAGYPYRVEQCNLDFRFIYGSWKFGNVILSKYPLVRAQSIDYPPEKAWEDWLVGCKRGVVCEVRLDASTSIRVAGVHLEHRGESTRFASGEMLVDLASAGPPLYAAGDFNSTPRGFPNSTTTPDGHNALDGLIQSGWFQHRPESDPGESELTFSSYDPKSVIDWILIPERETGQRRSPTYQVYQVLDSDLSDHLPVYAEISIGRSFH